MSGQFTGLLPVEMAILLNRTRFILHVLHIVQQSHLVGTKPFHREILEPLAILGDTQAGTMTVKLDQHGSARSDSAHIVQMPVDLDGAIGADPAPIDMPMFRQEPTLTARFE
jgi:hypothetical protein